MAKKVTKEVKPFYPLVHEFRESQDNVMEAASMLYNTVLAISKHIEMPAEIHERLDAVLKQYQAAVHGNT